MDSESAYNLGIEWRITVTHHDAKEEYEPDLDDLQLFLALLFLGNLLFVLVMLFNPEWF